MRKGWNAFVDYGRTPVALALQFIIHGIVPSSEARDDAQRVLEDHEIVRAGCDS